MKAAEIVSAFEATLQDDGSFRALCPVHENDGAPHSPSLLLSFNAEAKRVLLVCQSQHCDVFEIVDNVGLSASDLFDVEDIGQTGARTVGAASKTPASDDVRRSVAASAWKAAKILADHVDEEPDGIVASTLRDRFGIQTEGLDTAAADSLGIGYDPDERRIVVTARTADGGVAFVQARAIDPGATLRWRGLRNPPGSRWDAAGFIGRVAKDRTVVIVEGPSDALTVAALDEYDVVAVRGATQGRRISEVRDALTGRDVVVIPDADDAGRKFADMVRESLSATARSVRIAELPRAGMDVNDLRLSEPDTFSETLAAIIDAASGEETAATFDPAPLFVPGASHAQYAEAVRSYILSRGMDVHFTPSHGWMIWTGDAWITDAAAQVRQMVYRLADVLRRLAREADENHREDRAKRLTNIARKLSTTGQIDQTLRELSHMGGVLADISTFDADPDLLAVGNGVVDLRTGEVRPTRKEDRLTARLALDYDANATAPTWESFLRQIFIDDTGETDESLIDYMRTLIGYGITGHTSEQIFAILKGRGGNGKGVFVETLQSALSAITTTTPFETFEQRPSGGIPNDLAALKDARLVVASEGNQSAWMNEAVLKRITGSDTISARFLRKEFFSYKPQFLILLQTNHAPRLKGQDEGLWRRVRMIPFRLDLTEDQMDRELPEKLQRELPGILAWAVRGAAEWYANGRRLPTCRSVSGATSEYRHDSDALGEFMDLYVDRTGDPGDVTKQMEIVKAYQAWTEESGDRPFASSTIKAMLDERLGAARPPGSNPKAKRPRVYYGVKLRTEAEARAFENAAVREARRNHLTLVDG